MYVATITADEAVYAGGKYNKENLNYYLASGEFYLLSYHSISHSFYIDNGADYKPGAIKSWAHTQCLPVHQSN